MNPLIQLKKTLILPVRRFLSLGAIFALAMTAHAQSLYVSTQLDGAIFEYTPYGVQSTYDTGLSSPRGLVFDGFGNLFAAETVEPDNHDIGRVLKFNLRNHVNTVGSVAKFFFEGLSVDIAGNAYVIANDDNSPTGASTIFKFTPDGERIVFGSVPGEAFGLAFDSAGNLFAADSFDQTIYKFTLDGTRSVFVDPSAFLPDQGPVGLAFDRFGNLFVSTEGGLDPTPDDAILKFTPGGMKSTFAPGLSLPRGLAFDSSGNLFVTEHLRAPDGDILKFAPDGTHTVFASGLGRPEFLTFGPPR